LLFYRPLRVLKIRDRLVADKKKPARGISTKPGPVEQKTEILLYIGRNSASMAIMAATLFTLSSRSETLAQPAIDANNTQEANDQQSNLPDR
jgi:hypothetical protein